LYTKNYFKLTGRHSCSQPAYCKAINQLPVSNLECSKQENFDGWEIQNTSGNLKERDDVEDLCVDRNLTK